MLSRPYCKMQSSPILALYNLVITAVEAAHAINLTVGFPNSYSLCAAIAVLRSKHDLEMAMQVMK